MIRNTSTAEEDPPGLRLVPLRDWLSQQLPDVDTRKPLAADLMLGGRSNITYLLKQDDRRWVLRRPPLGHVMPTAHDMSREYRVLHGLSRVDFPVPRPLALCANSDVLDQPFMIMEYVEARVIMNATDAELVSEAEAGAISAALVATLGRLHKVDVVQAELTDLGRPDGYLSRQLRRWSKQWEITRTRELPDIDDLIKSLTGQIAGLPEDLPWSLVHGDFRVDNVMFGRNNTVVRAVLDWEMSTLGDPIFDLAIMLVYWSRPGEKLRHQVPIAEGTTDGIGFWSRSQLVSEYQRVTQRDLGHLDICLGLACLKLAVIMESISHRNRSGQQMGAAVGDGEIMGRATEVLVRMGLEVTLGGGVRALSL